MPLFRAILALVLASQGALAFDDPNYVRPKHSILVQHEDGSESRFHISQLTDNGPEKPGIFFLTDHNGSIQSRLNYPLDMKWIQKPKSEISAAAFETKLRSLNSDHPHHIQLGLLQGTEAAKELLIFLDTTSDAYDLIYPDKKEHKKFRRTVHRQKMTSGEIAAGEFNHMEREIPADEVIIRNRTTGEERKLSDFADVLVAKRKGNDEFLRARIGSFVAWMSGKEQPKNAPVPPAKTAFIERSYVPVKKNFFYIDHQDFEDDWRNAAPTRRPASSSAR